MDVEYAHQDGENVFKILCYDRMLSGNEEFYATVHKPSRRSFSNPPPVTGSRNEQITKSEAMENWAMSSVVEMRNSTPQQRHTRRNSIWLMWWNFASHMSVCQYLTSMVLRERHKSKLVDKISMVIIDMNECIDNIDMGLIWCLASPTVEDLEHTGDIDFTWREYASKILCLIIGRQLKASTIALVNDPPSLCSQWQRENYAVHHQ